MSKFWGPRYYFETKSFEPESLLSNFGNSNFLIIASGSKDLVDSEQIGLPTFLIIASGSKDLVDLEQIFISKGRFSKGRFSKGRFSKGRSRSYSYIYMHFAESCIWISEIYSKWTKSFEHVFILSKFWGPRYYFRTKSFEHVFIPSNFGHPEFAQNRVYLEGFGRFRCPQLTQYSP